MSLLSLESFSFTPFPSQAFAHMIDPKVRLGSTIPLYIHLRTRLFGPHLTPKDCFSIIKCLLAFWIYCSMWIFQLSLWSRVIPRYLVDWQYSIVCTNSFRFFGSLKVSALKCKWAKRGWIHGQILKFVKLKKHNFFQKYSGVFPL